MVGSESLVVFFSNGSSPIFVETSKISYRLPRGGRFSSRNHSGFAPSEVATLSSTVDGENPKNRKGIRISDMIWMILLDIETGHTT